MSRAALFGCVAGFVAVAGARAADLPVKAKPVEYVKICSLYGEGFFYIPGTDACLKVGGFLRYDTYFNQNCCNNPPNSGGAGLSTRPSSPDYITRSRADVSFDVRNQTEYGTLRAYYRGGFLLDSNSFANGAYDYQRAFIELGGWTFGRARSFFDIFSTQWSMGGAAFSVGGSVTFAFGTNLAAYTAQFGNGFSATLSLEDNNIRRNALWDATSTRAVAGVNPSGNGLPIGSTSIGPVGPSTTGYSGCGVTLLQNDNTIDNATTTSGLNVVGCGWGDYAAERVPDIVGNLKVQQAWGAAQISGALHEVRANYYGNNFVVASPSFTGLAPTDKWGAAVNAGIILHLPWNAGDEFWLEGTYALGAPAYTGACIFCGLNSAFARFKGGNLVAGWALDGVFANNAIDPFSGIQLSTSWVASAAVEHNWTPALRTSLWASYFYWTPGSKGNAIMCSSPLAPILTVAGNAAPSGAAALPGCDFTFTSWSVGTRTIWEPVKNFSIGLEVLYNEIDQNMDPNLIRFNFGGAGTRSAGLYVPSNEGSFAGMVRVQRNFYP